MAARVLETIMTFVDTKMETYVSSKTALLAEALQPAAITLMSVYIILWSFALIRGVVEEPFKEFFIRIIKIVVVFSLGINMMHYNELIVETFFKTPDLLANALSPSSTRNGTIASLDAILESSYQTGLQFWNNAGLLKGNIGAYICAFAVWIAGFAVCSYATFLIILSKIVLSVVIALGPLFIISLFFQATSKFFEAWIAQLSNYGLIVVLVTGVNLFIIGMFEDAATQAAKIGGNITIADAFPLIVTAFISLLVLAQVPQIAAGLAGGIAISSYGVGRQLAGLGAKPIKWGLNKVTRKAVTTIGSASKKLSRKTMNSYKARKNKISKAA